MPTGVANHVYQLGTDLVLRIPRASAFVPDLRKEAAIIPAARRLGVRTPAMVSYDDTCSIVAVPYMVLERAPGKDLDQHSPPPEKAATLLREVGRQLGMLHRGAPVLAAEVRDLPADRGADDPEVLVADLLDTGHIDADAARWLTAWFKHLAQHRPTIENQVLVHGDVSPQNLLATANGDLSGLVDWGDAMWSDPATDFAKLPLTAVPAVLEGYLGEASDQDDELSWKARVLWYHLIWALARLRHPTPAPGSRHWTAPPISRLLGLLRFFTGQIPEPWRTLIPVDQGDGPGDLGPMILSPP